MGLILFNEFFVFLQTDMRFFRVGCSVKIRKNGLHDDVVFRKFDLICIYIILNNENVHMGFKKQKRTVHE